MAVKIVELSLDELWVFGGILTEFWDFMTRSGTLSGIRGVQNYF